MKDGKLIVIEGACDGIGKSTQYAMLYDRLKREGYEDIIRHHFPSYGTYQSVPVEKYLSGEYGGRIEGITPYFVNCLYALDRGVTWHTSLKRYYEQGKIILLDRYTTSSIIYQSAEFDEIEERKRFIDYVVDFEYNKLQIARPDNVIFLYAPYDLITKILMARVGNDGIQNDVFERDLDHMKKIYENSMFVADYLSWDMICCNNGDEMRKREDLHEEIYSIIRKRIK